MAFPSDYYTYRQLGGGTVSLKRTYLTSDISATELRIPVNSTTGFPDGTSGIDCLQIGTPGTDGEIIRYTSIDGNYFVCGSASDRGYDDTTAYEHYINNWIGLCYPAAIHNRVCETIANIENFIRNQMRGGYQARADTTGIAQYDMVCLNSAERFTKADASHLGTSFVVGIAPLAIPPNTVGYVISGRMENSAWTWNPLKKLYLSTTAGQLSESQPATDNYDVCCGISITPTVAIIQLPEWGRIAKL